MEYYQQEVDEVIEHLHSSESGLKNDQVDSLKEKYGSNSIKIDKKVSFFNLLLLQFRGYLIWMLIFIAIFAYAVGFVLNRQEQIIDGVIITMIVLINSFAGAYQDYKSEKSAELLKNLLKNQALVLRDGKKKTIDSEELVPGDIIFLSEGNKVPADARIIKSHELHVDESMLTGESEHVVKVQNKIAKEVTVADRKNMVYMNTYITRGAATCIVTAISKNTEVGKIAKSLDVEQKSSFIQEVDTASKKITYVAMSFILIAMTVFYLQDNSWISVFMIGSALVIGSIPEGLPAIVTFSLAVTSSRLAKKNVIVKRKTLLETLGSVDIICTDKTGTLTNNEMTVKKLFFEGGTKKYKSLSPLVKQEFLNCALLCNEAKDTERGFVGDAEDIALIDFFNDIGTDIIELRKNNPLIKLSPFSSEKKYASSTNQVKNKKITYMKGAPEIILSNCKKIVDKGKIRDIRKEDQELVRKKLAEFSQDALRMIGFSFSDNKSMVFLGIVGIYDSPKKDIKDTINAIYNAQVEIKMITGDNVDTAKAIAKECGFKKIKAISWDELKDLSEPQLKEIVLECNVFARMSPEYKLKIVSALQACEKRVAITGDGVNDVPALKKAEVGIAMGKKGSDIAKEAADLVLLDDDLSMLLEGIKGGRTIFSNIRKVINYLLTANLAEILVVFAASLIGVVPFLPIQLLWVNFVTDIAPAMALGIDPSHDNIMKKRPTGKEEKLINKRITLLTIFIGLKKFVIMFVVFLVTLNLSNNLALAQTMSFTWLVISHFIRIASIRFDENVFVFNNKFLNWSLIIPVAFQLLIIYTPLSKLFQTVPLSIMEWVVILFAVLIGIALAKVITFILDKHVPITDKDY